MSSLTSRPVQFKHSDTRLLITFGLVYIAFAVGGWFLLGEAGLYVAVGAAFVLGSGLHLHLYRARQAEAIAHLTHTQDLLALHALVPLRAPLPPLTGWAASPALALTLLDLVRERRPEHVVELGSGASSLVIGYGLEQVGRGRLFSFDHDAAYAAVTAGRVAQHGLSERVTVTHAPLREHRLDGRRFGWYDLGEADLPERIDLLVIDGPPLETNALARYPAGPLLFDRLADDAVVVLDDAQRDDEQEAVRRWMEQIGDFTCTMVPGPKGLAVLRRIGASGTGR